MHLGRAPIFLSLLPKFAVAMMHEVNVLNRRLRMLRRNSLSLPSAEKALRDGRLSLWFATRDLSFAAE